MKDPARIKPIEGEEEPPTDERVVWENENIEMEDRKPTLEELDEDPEAL